MYSIMGSQALSSMAQVNIISVPALELKISVIGRVIYYMNIH